MTQSSSQRSDNKLTDESLFRQLVAPALLRANQLQRQFERLNSHDVSEHQQLLQDIEQAEHNVWQAIALATADINPSLISEVSAASPMSLKPKDKVWMEKCLAESSLPLLEEGDFTPIRFLQDRR